MDILVRRQDQTSAQPAEAMSQAERDIRVDLAACYRLIAHFGMNELTYNHISARIPGEAEAFLINPFGLMFEEVCASNLVKVNARGEVLNDPVGLGINEAGFVIHGAVHEARLDAACVIHTHTPAGMAVAAHADGLLPLSQTAMLFHGRIGYHDYEGIAIDMDERRRLAENLGSHPAMILRNHGLLAVGGSIAEAFNTIFFLERACQAQVHAMAGGAKLHFPAEDAARKTAKIASEHGFQAAARDWPALLRMAERLDPGFRE